MKRKTLNRKEIITVAVIMIIAIIVGISLFFTGKITPVWKVNEKSAYALAVKDGYIGTPEQWLASLAGEVGENGKSSYDLAVENGYKKDAATWLSPLLDTNDNTDKLFSKNTKKEGNSKSAYERTVENGFAGSEKEWKDSFDGVGSGKGKSTYEIAVENGFVGSSVEWLDSLKGTTASNDKFAYNIASSTGFHGNQTEWLAALATENGAYGENGKSAYELAQDNGYTGTLSEWLDSLIDKDELSVQNEQSAYEFAVANGYNGTLTKWLASLVETQGKNDKSAYQRAVENGYNGTQQEWLAVLVDATNQNSISTYELADTDDENNSVSKNEINTASANVNNTLSEEFTAPTLTVSNATAAPGDVVEVAVSVHNNPGIVAMLLNVEFDNSAMTLTKAVSGEAVKNVLTFTKSKTLENKSKFMWDGQEIATEDIKDGEVLILTFTVNENASSGTYPIKISYQDGDIVDNDLSPVSIDIINGNIEIS